MSSDTDAIAAMNSLRFNIYSFPFVVCRNFHQDSPTNQAVNRNSYFFYIRR